MMIGMKMRLAQLNPKIRWHGVPKFMTHRVKMVEFDPESKMLMAQVEVNIRKISRKRLERIAMAMGIHARDAKFIADQAHQFGLEYKDALRALILAADETNELEEDKEEGE